MSDHRYDFFISYSTKDTWARDWLLPRLEATGLKVCIDFRDFEIGVSKLDNIENAVTDSRHTLCVFSPNYLENEYNGFEGLLVQSRDPAARHKALLPLMLVECPQPPGLAVLTWANFCDSANHETELERLLNQIGATTLPKVDMGLRQRYNDKIADKRKTMKKLSEDYAEQLSGCTLRAQSKHFKIEEGPPGEYAYGHLIASNEGIHLLYRTTEEDDEYPGDPYPTWTSLSIEQWSDEWLLKIFDREILASLEADLKKTFGV